MNTYVRTTKTTPHKINVNKMLFVSYSCFRTMSSYRSQQILNSHNISFDGVEHSLKLRAFLVNQFAANPRQRRQHSVHIPISAHLQRTPARIVSSVHFSSYVRSIVICELCCLTCGTLSSRHTSTNVSNIKKSELMVTTWQFTKSAKKRTCNM